MNKRPPSTQYEADLEQGPGPWPSQYFTSDETKKKYADEQQKIRDDNDYEEKRLLAKHPGDQQKTYTPKTSVSPVLKSNTKKHSKEYKKREEIYGYRASNRGYQGFAYEQTPYSEEPNDTNDVSFGKAFSKNRANGAKEFVWKGKKYTTKIKEEMNVVSGGDIAGVGVGPDGEPGIPKKRRPKIPDLLTFMKRK